MRLAIVSLVGALVAPLLAYTAPAGGGGGGGTVIKMERSSRELAITFIYEGLIQNRDPLDLFDDADHSDFWFSRSAKSLAQTLESATVDREYAPKNVVRRPKKSNSPLLAARAARAQRTRTAPPPTLQRARPKNLPNDAVPDGPETSAPDRRSGASRGLVRSKLATLASRRVELETAINEHLDPLIAHKVPAMDVAILLLFLSEMGNGDAGGLPPAIAAKEAVTLSVAYSGDEQQSFRHVHGILGAYARERLGLGEE